MDLTDKEVLFLAQSRSADMSLQAEDFLDYENEAVCHAGILLGRNVLMDQSMPFSEFAGEIVGLVALQSFWVGADRRRQEISLISDNHRHEFP